MFMLRSTHEEIVESKDWLIDYLTRRNRYISDGTRASQKGLLRLQRRHKKLKEELRIAKRDLGELQMLLDTNGGWPPSILTDHNPFFPNPVTVTPPSNAPVA